ncbi:MAG: aromatic ring-hydroxylating dioxygenase subunit alpha [Pseudomonadota bacterium]
MSKETELRYGLPSGHYLAPEIFAAEQERIFRKSWHFAGHLESLRRPGDYVTCRIAGDDIVVLRDRAGVLRAFHNVCRHRAHQLLSGEGKVNRIVCPYHAWTYDLDGRLIAAVNSAAVPRFDKRQICLLEVRVEAFCHLVCVNLDPEAEPLAALYPGLEGEIRARVPDIEPLRLADRADKVVAANWKVIVENFSECYHCIVAHPTFTSGVVDPASYRITVQGALQRHDSAAQPNRPDERFTSWLLWPMSAFQVYPGGAVNTFQWHPLSAGRTRLVNEWFFPNDPMTVAQEALVREHRSTTFIEDFPLVESVQRGLSSRAYENGPVMIDRAHSELSEHGVLAFQDRVRGVLGNL